VSTLRLRLLASNWNPPRVLARWPFAPKCSPELRALQRRLAVARLGIDAPRRPIRLAPYDDLQ
jgi:hypothetical protein